MSGIAVQLPECVSVVEGVGGLPALSVTGEKSSGVVQLQGAQVTSFVPAGGVEMLWLSPLAVAGSGAAIRGGVPVCFPWFGSGSAGDRRPSHGPARLARWRVKGAQVVEGDVVVSFVLTPDAVASVVDAEVWPSDLFAELTVTFGDRLGLALEARNESGDPADVECAFHTYLAVDDVRDVRVVGLDGCVALDQADGGESGVSGDVRFGGEVDLAVEAPDRSVTLSCPDGALAEVERDGCPDVVVWNPHVAKAAQLVDVPDDAWTDFVCIEAAALRGNAVRIDAGGSCAFRAAYVPGGTSS